MEEMKRGEVHSLKVLQLNDGAYCVAKKHGLLATMENLFRMEAEGQSPVQTREHLQRGCYSWTQEIVTMIFKGNREVVDRFTCACPSRTKVG